MTLIEIFDEFEFYSQSNDNLIRNITQILLASLLCLLRMISNKVSSRSHTHPPL